MPRPVPAPTDVPADPSSTLPPSLPPDAALWGEAEARVLRDAPPGRLEASADDADGPAPTIGHIGRYALKHQLGEGGIGTVYAAHDPLLSRLIAVKTLHVEVDESEREAFNALFLNEARAAGRLNHPNIVTVFDAGISNDRAYIAMELLKGRDLRQLRQDGWRATPAQAALIVRRVADALGYAHSKGVVHCDVKPANIFMTGRTQPKVLDFGIARIARQHESTLGSAADIAAGSPYYMAPEQVRHEDVDRRADVFSLGIVLYELLTGLKPFRGATLDEITTAVLTHAPPPANAIDAAVPEALARITAKALAKNPDQRHRSARAFARELRHWLDENTVTPEGDAPAAEAPRPRWSAWIALAALGSVVAIGAIASFVPLGARTAATPVSAATAPSLPPAPAALARPAAATALAAAGAIATEDATAAPRSGAARPPNVASAGASAITPIENPIVPSASRAASGSPAPAAAVAKPRPTPREAPRERRAREARERAARAGAVAPTITRSATTSGIVRIAISPWGEVEVDGQPAGTSPPLTELSLSAGRHRIVIRNSDLPAHQSTVDVSADQPVTVKHRF